MWDQGYRCGTTVIAKISRSVSSGHGTSRGGSAKSSALSTLNVARPSFSPTYANRPEGSRAIGTELQAKPPLCRCVEIGCRSHRICTRYERHSRFACCSDLAYARNYLGLEEPHSFGSQLAGPSSSKTAAEMLVLCTSRPINLVSFMRGAAFVSSSVCEDHCRLLPKGALL